MITTRRDDVLERSDYSRSEATAGVDLLERQAPETVKSYSINNVASTESFEEAKQRMQRNLDRLLHYDSNAGVVQEEPTYTVENYTPVQENVVEQSCDVVDTVERETVIVNSSTVQLQEDDIRPTSTTMQFGDGDSDGIYNDMNRSSVESKESYRLNTKGKIVVAFYALAVTIILALIVMNTGFLASLKTSNAELATQRDAKILEYNTVAEELTEKSSEEYVRNWAIENGMTEK